MEPGSCHRTADRSPSGVAENRTIKRMAINGGDGRDRLARPSALLGIAWDAGEIVFSQGP